MNISSSSNGLAKAGASEQAPGELVYIDQIDKPISRRATPKGFHYFNADGRRVTDKNELDRIQKLAIPPAYIDIQISPDANAHLQAVGRDARGRKQYRYHPRWTAERGEAKFALLSDFANALPRIRQQVDRDLRRTAPSAEKAIATVVWLLDNLNMRVGNPAYARDNGSFGATTLRSRHLKIHGSEIRFRFKGKSAKEWNLSYKDRRISKAVKSLQELPGQEVFQYLDEKGGRHPVRSQDVNAYIREAAGGDFSSRQFRTWAATYIAATELAKADPNTSRTDATKAFNQVIDLVAGKLMNTRAVCRSSYIHPLVLEHHATGQLREINRIRLSRRQELRSWMDEEEIRVMQWLNRITEKNTQ